MEGHLYVVFPKEVWSRICHFLDVKEVIALSRTCRFVHGVCESSTVWEGLFKDYYNPTTTRDVEPPFVGFKLSSRFVEGMEDGVCLACMAALLSPSPHDYVGHNGENDGEENDEEDVGALWQAPCGHYGHERCLKLLRDRVAAPCCEECGQEFVPDKEEGDEGEETPFVSELASRALIQKRMESWSSRGPDDWKAEFKAIYCGGATEAKSEIWKAIRGGFWLGVTGCVVAFLWLLVVLYASGALGTWSFRILLASVVLLFVMVLMQEIRDSMILLRRRGEIGFAIWMKLSFWFELCNQFFAILMMGALGVVVVLFLLHVFWYSESIIETIVGFFLVAGALGVSIAVWQGALWWGRALGWTFFLGLPLSKVLIIDLIFGYMFG